MSAPAEQVQARWLSDVVLDLASAGPVSGSVTARFGSAVHAEVAGFALALLPPGAPRLPNSLVVPAGLADERAPEIGDPVLLSRGRLTAGALTVAWDAARPPRWDARVRRWPAGGGEALGERAREILGRHREGTATAVARETLTHVDGLATDDAGARQGIASLLAAIRTRDPRLAARASSQLVGHGPGLTPLGDDILAATALAVASGGAAVSWSSRVSRAWLAALAPADLRRRTTALSATLLQLATRGRGVEPVHELLDPEPTSRPRLAAALDRMTRLGHTTGPAYAAAVGSATLVLSSAMAGGIPRPRRTPR